MKRSLDQITNQIKKKSKTSQSLHHFFLNQPILNQPNENDKYNKKTISQLKKNIIKMPNDIKRIIIKNTFNIPEEWWYCEKKWNYTNKIYALSFNPKDNNLAIGFSNGMLTIVNPETPEIEILSSLNINKTIFALTYNNDGSLLACGLQGELKIMSSENYENSSTYPLRGYNWTLSFNSDSTQLTVGTEKLSPQNNMEASIKIIDINNQKENFSNDINNEVYGVYMHSNDELTYALSNQKVETLNIKTKQEKNINPLKEKNINSLNTLREFLLALAYNKNNNTFALGFNNNDNNDNIALGINYNNKVLIINPLTNKTISSFNNNSPVYSLSFTEDGQNLAVGLRNGTLLLLKKHNQATEKQHLLRRILYLWLQVEKPNLNIKSPKKLLHTISTKFCLNKKQLTTTWATFPEPLQVNLWHNMNSLIQKYGKKV